MEPRGFLFPCIRATPEIRAAHRNLHMPCTYLAVSLILAGCSNDQAGTPAGSESDYSARALEFTNALADRQYAKAYQLTSTDYREVNSIEQLQTEFESIVPSDWGTPSPIEIAQVMTNWPDKAPTDLGWVYVSIGGDAYSEAITVVITSEQGEARIRAVEFGRP